MDLNGGVGNRRSEDLRIWKSGRPARILDRYRGFERGLELVDPSKELEIGSCPGQGFAGRDLLGGDSDLQIFRSTISRAPGRCSARRHDTNDCHMQSCLTCQPSPWLRTWPSVWEQLSGQLSHALPVPHRAIYAASVEADRLARAYDPTISDACGRGPSTLV